MAKRPKVLFFKAHVEGYTRADGTAVAPHEDSRPAAAADGWEVHRTYRDGAKDHRKLMVDGGAPRFRGSAKRYAWVHEHPTGEVYARSEHGYMTRHASVEDAKRHLDRPKKTAE